MDAVYAPARAAGRGRYDGGMPDDTRLLDRPHWQRVLWGGAGLTALLTGLVGIFVPLLPTTPFVLLAAFCFSRSSRRCEHWLLSHPRFGPVIRDWRTSRSIPLRAKQFAWGMMAIGSAWAWWMMPRHLGWIPPLCCAAVAWWMWTLPSRPDDLPPP
jgi:uncharacterized protein